MEGLKQIASALILTALFLLNPQRGFAFPGLIGFGYTSCLNCHYNPLGNGPLTDYGRALGASEVSARVLTPNASDEDVGKNSGFLGPFGQVPSWLSVSADYRGLFLKSGLEGTKSTQRWINMQAEGSLVLKFKDERWVATGTLGYVPPSESLTPAQRDKEPKLISREHYVSYRSPAGFGLYAGFMDPAFGVRVPEHILFIRYRTLLDINDQTHGFLVHGMIGGRVEGAAHFMTGNLLQSAGVRQKGAAFTAEVEPQEKVRVGGSFLSTKSDYRARQMGALHARLGVGYGSSILSEYGLARETPQGGAATTGDFALVQGMARVFRGTYLLMNFERFTDNIAQTGTRTYRFGPALDFFPMQRLELRMDFQGTRIQGGTVQNQDVYSLLTQVHVWL